MIDCNDCQYIKPSRFGYEVPLCGNPKLLLEVGIHYIHLGVFKEKASTPRLCSMCRMLESLCGKKAKHFMPKPQ